MGFDSLVAAPLSRDNGGLQHYAKEREKIDIQKLGRFVSNAMLAGVPSALLSPLMPTMPLYTLLLCWIPCGIVVVVGIYVNVCKKKFEK